MRGNDGTRTGGEILIDQLAIHGVRHVFCVPGESYLAALDAFHDRDDRAHRLPPRKRRRDDGRGGRQDDRPARHLLRHARAGRHQCLGRHPYRAAGFHADDRVRRPGRRATMREREAFQELDYRAVFGSIAKWATEIDDPARIPEIVVARLPHRLPAAGPARW